LFSTPQADYVRGLLPPSWDYYRAAFVSMLGELVVPRASVLKQVDNCTWFDEEHVAAP
jgi:hypothetical protein